MEAGAVAEVEGGGEEEDGAEEEEGDDAVDGFESVEVDEEDFSHGDGEEG